ncbi:MAG: type II secretion system protein, partial [Rhodocyclaceae bacterium]|nr:type II secretion system protein [Rhodocyclaceae bacterium]
MPQLTSRHARPPQGGFTLVELAVTLLVVTILASMLLIPLTGREAIRTRQETGRQLEAIREALIGYAIIHGSLPCPTHETNPASVDYGLPDASCNQTVEGYLPWRILGLPQTDAWGVTRLAPGDPWLGYWRYRVVPILAVDGTPIQATTVPDLDLDVRDVVTGQLMVDDKALAALVYSTGP